MGDVIMVLKNQTNFVVNDFRVHSQDQILYFTVGILLLIDLNVIKVVPSQVKKTYIYLYVT